MSNVTYRIPVRNNMQDSLDALPETAGVSNISGVLVDGQEISINGFGFGIAGNVLQHSRGDEGSAGAPIHGTTPLIGPAFDTYVLGVDDDTAGNHLLYTSARTRGARRPRVFRRRHLNPAGEYNAGGFGVTGFTSDELYVSFWSYDYIPAWDVKLANFKKTFAFGNAEGGFPQAILFAATGGSRYGFYQNISDGTISFNERNNINTKDWRFENTRDQWVFWECWFKLNSAPGAYDGMVRVRRNGELGIVNNNWRASDVVGLYDEFYLGYMDRDMDPTCTFDFTDLLVATKPSRVVLGDNPTWEFCSHRETQFTRDDDWSDNFIVTTVNLGAFNVSVGSTLYLYIINSQDEPVSTVGYPVTVSS